METLTTECDIVRKCLRRVDDESEKVEIKAKIAILTKDLGEMRKEVSLCVDIAERTMENNRCTTILNSIGQRFKIEQGEILTSHK